MQKLLRRPRTSLVWKLNFQVHLWVGLLLTLYLIVIGLTGSILVFRVELERISGLRPWQAALATSRADPDRVLENVEAAYRSRRILSLRAPTGGDPFFTTTVQGFRRPFSVRSDPQTGQVLSIIQPRRSWLDFIADLHATWLAGIKGRIANGVGGALLLIVNLTGLVVWWPGTKLWKRGLTVDFRRTWRRINFDLHRAVGFWAISILSFWAISGIYFGWPQQVFALVNRVSPIISARPPVVQAKPVWTAAKPTLATIIASAQSMEPGTTFMEVDFPYSRRAPFEILMQRAGGRGREYTDTLYFNPSDGRHLKTWRYGVNESVGDWLIWLQIPLHYGTYWGFGVKLLWAALGLTIPLLAVTGMLLYWNRVLRRLLLV